MTGPSLLESALVVCCRHPPAFDTCEVVCSADKDLAPDASKKAGVGVSYG